MANTYTLISSVTVGAGGASSIDFTSIPNTYTDLLLDLSIRGASNAASNGFFYQLKLNGSSTSYTGRTINGQGTSATSGSYTGIYGYNPASDYTANTFNNDLIYIPNYAGSTNKSLSIDSTSENNSATVNNLTLVAALWSNTAAVNQLTITMGGGNVAQYSTAYLYGIKNS